MPLVVHYWADLQSVHGLRCYGNIMRTRNVSKYLALASRVLALCLVLVFLCFVLFTYLYVMTFTYLYVMTMMMMMNRAYKVHPLTTRLDLTHHAEVDSLPNGVQISRP